jgi:hypothetical protein
MKEILRTEIVGTTDLKKFLKKAEECALGILTYRYKHRASSEFPSGQYEIIRKDEESTYVYDAEDIVYLCQWGYSGNSWRQLVHMALFAEDGCKNDDAYTAAYYDAAYYDDDYEDDDER